MKAFIMYRAFRKTIEQAFTGLNSTDKFGQHICMLASVLPWRAPFFQLYANLPVNAPCDSD
jgi:hypothetical protein